jgi:CoA:oxalate CoA-transferase
MAIFQNITILDLTHVLSGPLATRHFADQGANIIKIEPIGGDDSRCFPPIIGEWSGYFETLNRNKKSLVIDLKAQSGLERFYELCKTADLIVENFSPTIKTKLKIDYKTIKLINPKIIYASLYGINKDNPRKYYDIIAQGESGLASLNGNQVNRSAILDAFTGMKLAFAISSSLFWRQKHGEGMEINVSMLGCGFDLLEQNLITTSITKQNPDTTFDTAISPFGVFHTLTNDITIAIGNDNQWQVFVAKMNELGSDFNFEAYPTNQIRLYNAQIINSNIQIIFSQFSAADLYTKMQIVNIPCGIVATMKDVLNNQDNYSDQLLQKVDISKVGKVVVANGGILYTDHPATNYQNAPRLNDYEL